MAELRALHARVERAAGEALRLLAESGADGLEIGLSSDDAEARSLGWPCVGAHAACLGLVAARAAVPVRVVPRGATVPTAAAADARGG